MILNDDTARSGSSHVTRGAAPCELCHGAGAYPCCYDDGPTRSGDEDDECATGSLQTSPISGGGGTLEDLVRRVFGSSTEASGFIDLNNSRNQGQAFDTIYHLVPKSLIYSSGYLVVGYTGGESPYCCVDSSTPPGCLMGMNILLCFSRIPPCATAWSPSITIGVAVAIYGMTFSWSRSPCHRRNTEKNSLLRAETDLANRFQKPDKRTHNLVLLSLRQRS